MTGNALLRSLGLSALMMLGGCQALSSAPQTQGSASNCFVNGPPALVEGVCLLPTWVAFGRESQRGDAEWRQQTLAAVEGDNTRARLVKAVVLSWGPQTDWKEAEALYRANTDDAPNALQPLLTLWRNELDARRQLASEERSNSTQRVDRLQKQIAELQEENAQLSKKLEALTAIEESMNARRQTP